MYCMVYCMIRVHDMAWHGMAYGIWHVASHWNWRGQDDHKKGRIDRSEKKRNRNRNN
jgi:hypothetical protein